MKTFVILLFFSCAAMAQELVTLPVNGSPHVDIRLQFRTGSVDDPKGKEGLTYLTAQLIADGGTQSLSKTEIDELLYPFAADFSVSVDKQSTVVYTSIHVDHLGQLSKLFCELLLKPRFDEKDFSRIKENALKAVTKDIPDNNDENLSKFALDLIMYEGHPYAHLVQGTKSSLEKLTLDDVKAHYAAVFTRNRLMIGVAGGFKPEFAEGLRKELSALPEGAAPAKLSQVRMPNGSEVLVVSKETAFGSAIYMGFPMAVDRASDDFAAMLVASSYLGEHRKSYGLLYKNMRGKRSLNYGDYSYVEWYPAGHAVSLPLSGYPRQLNAFGLWIRPVQIAQQFNGVEGLETPALGNGVFSIRQAVRELRMLIENGIPEEDFQRTRTFMQGYLRLFVQSQSSRLGFLMDGRVYGRQNYIEEMIALMGKLTAADVNAAIRKYLVPDKLYISVVTDDSEAKGLAEALKSDASAPIVYTPVVRSGLSQDILDEDKQIDATKLGVTKIQVVDKANLFQ